MALKELVAPVAGRVIPLGDVPDATFSSGVLGWGVGIVPTEGRVFAPVDGVAENVMDTGHAVGLTTKEGLELLIHVGKDTVALNGQYFTLHVQEGDQVKAGQLLIEFDMAAIQAAGYELVTPVTAIGAEAGALSDIACGDVAVGDALFTVDF